MVNIVIAPAIYKLTRACIHNYSYRVVRNTNNFDISSSATYIGTGLPGVEFREQEVPSVEGHCTPILHVGHPVLNIKIII